MQNSSRQKKRQLSLLEIRCRHSMLLKFLIHPGSCPKSLNMYQQIQDLLDKIGSYPEKPKKPVLDRNHNAEQARDYAMSMEVYEVRFAEFEKNRIAYYQRQGEIEHMIVDLISRESGLFNIPEQYRKKVWSIAWEEGHGAGYHEVYQWLTRLVEIFE